jgi:hypothetical protein
MLDRFRSLPLWALLPIVFVLVAVIDIGFSAMTPDDHQRFAAHLVSGLIYAAVMTAFVGIMISVRRRRAGGAANLTEMQHALRSGELPQDADARTWLPEFERWERQFRRNRWTAPIVFGLATLLAVWLATQNGPAWLLFGVLFVGVTVWSVLSSNRYLGRLHRMIAELRQRPAAQGFVPDDAPAPTPGAVWPTAPHDVASDVEHR